MGLENKFPSVYIIYLLIIYVTYNVVQIQYNLICRPVE